MSFALKAKNLKKRNRKIIKKLMLFQNRKEKVIIIDFGSQLTKLIARRIRELGVFFSEILTIQEFNKITNYNQIKGIILSGGPATVTKKIF